MNNQIIKKECLNIYTLLSTILFWFTFMYAFIVPVIPQYLDLLLLTSFINFIIAIYFWNKS